MGAAPPPRPVPAQRAAVREVALETAPFSGVTTSRGLAAAGMKLDALSRDTVLRAIDILRSEGLVFTVPRRGTYVSPDAK
jgi:hypothetical protein